MAKSRLPDDLWALVASLLPPDQTKPKRGQLRVPDRAARTGIRFVLKRGNPWEMLPQELGTGSGMTRWRRLRDWQASAVWDRPHRARLDHFGERDGIDWSRARIDSASVPARRGASTPAPLPRIVANRG